MRAFTLTELLVVIAIVAILAALSGVAVMRAVDTAKQTRIKTEIDQLHAAFEAYKQKYGSYPPCDLRISQVNAMPPLFKNLPLRRHVAQAFPKYDLRNLAGDIGAAGVETRSFRPDQALVFWLSGFNPDPAHPFKDLQSLSRSERTSVFYDFDDTRLRAIQTPMPSPYYPGTSVESYFPPGTKFESGIPSRPPYVYFDWQSYGVVPDFNAEPSTFDIATYADGEFHYPPIFPDAGAAVPYWNDVNGNGSADAGEGWVNSNSFQIIAAGGDGKYGSDAIIARLYKTGTGYTLADEDNVANFCPRPRLGDERP